MSEPSPIEFMRVFITGIWGAELFLILAVSLCLHLKARKFMTAKLKLIKEQERQANLDNAEIYGLANFVHNEIMLKALELIVQQKKNHIHQMYSGEIELLLDWKFLVSSNTIPALYFLPGIIGVCASIVECLVAHCVIWTITGLILPFAVFYSLETETGIDDNSNKPLEAFGKFICLGFFFLLFHLIPALVILFCHNC